MTGGSNIVRLGEQQAREALHTAIRQACITAKISPSQIRAVCIGAAGAGRPETAAKIRGILEELIPGIPREKIEVAGDAVIALEAAFGAGSGVIAIAGTGSIVYGRDATGNVARAGGWGFAISDEGSGHWIGRRAIALAMTARDEGLETALTDGILQAWKFNTIDELVQRANATPPPDFPPLFRAVLHAAEEGDAIAGELLVDAGTRLAALAAIVVRRLAPAAPLTIAALPIAMTGSVFRQSHQVRQIFYDTLQKNFPGIDVRPDLVDPVEGALDRAKRL